MAAEIAIANLQRLRIERETTFGRENRFHSIPDPVNVVTAAVPTNQATAETAANELKDLLNAHFLSDDYHPVADTVNEVTSADASDLASLQTLCAELRVDYLAHLQQAGVHVQNDTRNTVTAASTADLPACIALLTELQTDWGHHLAETNTHDWTDIHASDIELTRERQTHRRLERTQRLTQRQTHVLGRRGGKLSFGHYLQGDGVALTTGATPAEDSLHTLLECALGGGYSAAGSTCAAGSTTTVLNVQPGHGARFRAGTFILIEGTGEGGENEQALIRSVATDAITLEIALSHAPPADAAVWNSYTVYIDPSATATLQALLTGEAAADVFLALGLAGGFTLADLLQLEQPARVMFDLAYARWETDTDTLAAGTYDGADPLGTAEDLEIQWQDHGTQTRNLISCSALELVPGVTWTQLMARGAADVEHVDRVRMTLTEPSGSFTADVDSDFLADYEAQTVKMLLIMNGRTAGSSWAIAIPRCVISALPTRAIHAEQTATSVQIVAFENDAGDASTALMRSPIIISRL